MILQGCRYLVHLGVRNSLGFEPDEKVFELASHIDKFQCEGSMLEDDSTVRESFRKNRRCPIWRIK